MTRLRLLVLPATAIALVSAASGSSRGVKEGGTFRVAVIVGRVDTIDPALVNFPPEVQLFDPSCARLMAYPDRALPAGFRLTPSLAEDMPRVSKDGRTYTLAIREGIRFSTGAAVTARAFAHAIERELDPKMKSGLAFFWLDIAGAQAFSEGKATTITGLTAKGRTLTLRLTRRVPDLTERLADLCAVPPNLP